MRLKLSLTCNYFNDQGLLPGSVARYGVYVTATGSLQDIGIAASGTNASGLVANIWPFLNRDADSVSQWVQPAGWVSLKNENPNTTVNYYGFFNDYKTSSLVTQPFQGFYIEQYSNIYAYSTPNLTCTPVSGRFYISVCGGKNYMDGSLEYPCTLPRVVTTSTFRKQSNNNLQIYPNPTSDNFVIHSKSELLRNIMLLDVTGKIQLTIDINSNRDEDVIDISQLSSGIYTAIITTSKTTYYEKVVKH